MPFIYYNLEVGICLAVLYAIYFVFLRGTTFHKTNRVIVLLSVISAFVFPTLDIATDSQATEDMRIVEMQDEARNYVAHTSVPTISTLEKRGGFKNPINVVYYAYLVLISAALLRYGYSNTKILVLLKQSKITSVNGKSIYIIDKDISPFTYFNKIVIPRSIFESSSRDAVIAHELTHAIQWHNLDLHIMELLKSFQLLNPFIYLFARDLKATHEYIADSGATSFLRSKAEYMDSLVNLTLGANVASLANSFDGIKLIRRIKMLEKKKSSAISGFKYLLVLPTIAVLFIIFACNSNHKKTHMDYEKPDKYAELQTESIRTEFETRLEAKMPADWATGEKTAKFWIGYEIDEKGNIGEPFISNSKFADHKKWQNGRSIDKEMENILLSIIKDINPKYKPAMKDGKAIKALDGFELIVGDEQKWHTYNASGTVMTKLPHADYKVGYNNPAEDAESDMFGLPVLSHKQCYRIPKIIEFPEEARTEKAKGEVELTFSVDANGLAQDVKVEKRAGYGFDESAVTAIKELGGFRPNQKFNGKDRLPVTILFEYGTKM